GRGPKAASLGTVVGGFGPGGKAGGRRERRASPRRHAPRRLAERRPARRRLPTAEAPRPASPYARPCITRTAIPPFLVRSTSSSGRPVLAPSAGSAERRVTDHPANRSRAIRPNSE